MILNSLNMQVFLEIDLTKVAIWKKLHKKRLYVLDLDIISEINNLLVQVLLLAAYLFLMEKLLQTLQPRPMEVPIQIYMGTLYQPQQKQVDHRQPL